MQQRCPSNRVHFSGQARGFVVALFALMVMVAPAFAVKPYTDPRYKLQKAPLKQGMSMQQDSKRQFRFKKGEDHALSRNGIVPGYQRGHWNWPKPKRQGRRV